MLSEPELLSLMRDIESFRVERTISTTDTDKFREAICAFSNDMLGSGQLGYLLIGVDDKTGLPVGLNVSDHLLLKLSAYRSDGTISPAPVITADKHTFSPGTFSPGASEIAVVEVHPSPLPPVRYKGRICIRSGPHKGCANEAQERILSDRRITSAFHQAVTLAADKFKADLALIDVGPNLGALNRCAVLAADHIAVPLVPDLFSLQGLSNLGPTLQSWRNGWAKRLAEAPPSGLNLPKGEMRPAGYVVIQHAIRANRPTKAYSRWADRIPAAYGDAMRMSVESELTLETDPQCLAQLKHYRSLMPMAMEARKPIFRLTPADGAIGAHASAVADCGRDFEKLARALAASTGLTIP